MNDEERLKKRLANIMIAVGMIMERHPRERGIAGYIECPVCKGRLRYSIARSNGHIWGQCETKDCLGWVQ